MPYPSLRSLDEEESKKFMEIDRRPITKEERENTKRAVEVFEIITLNSMRDEKEQIRNILNDWKMIQEMTENEIQGIIESLIRTALGWDKKLKEVKINE